MLEQFGRASQMQYRQAIRINAGFVQRAIRCRFSARQPGCHFRLFHVSWDSMFRVAHQSPADQGKVPS